MTHKRRLLIVPRMESQSHHSGAHDALLLLLRCGADVETTDDHGRTPLFRYTTYTIHPCLHDCARDDIRHRIDDSFYSLPFFPNAPYPFVSQIMFYGANCVFASAIGLGRTSKCNASLTLHKLCPSGLLLSRHFSIQAVARSGEDCASICQVTCMHIAAECHNFALILPKYSRQNTPRRTPSCCPRCLIGTQTLPPPAGCARAASHSPCHTLPRLQLLQRGQCAVVTPVR